MKRTAAGSGLAVFLSLAAIVFVLRRLEPSRDGDLPLQSAAAPSSAPSDPDGPARARTAASAVRLEAVALPPQPAPSPEAAGSPPAAGEAASAVPEARAPEKERGSRQEWEASQAAFSFPNIAQRWLEDNRRELAFVAMDSGSVRKVGTNVFEGVAHVREANGRAGRILLTVDLSPPGWKVKEARLLGR